MLKYKTFIINFCITNRNKVKIKVDLKQYSVYGNKYTTNTVEIVILMSVRPEFIETQIVLIQKNKGKIMINTLLKIKSFSLLIILEITSYGQMSSFI